MRTGARIAQRFFLERLAASGGMGDVYRALDETAGMHVAVKLLQLDPTPDSRERFEREARLLAELRHPAIPRYVTHGRLDDGTLYLAMEWLEGEDLRARLLRAPVALDDTLALAQRVAEALAAAHAAGIVHRDIKPENIFLPAGSFSDAKVLDFGVARRVNLPARAATRTGTTLGTPGYMAPEQARASRDIDARADVFSLGCVLYECLVGRPAFAADNIMAVLAKVLLEDAPHAIDDSPAVSEPLDALVTSMMSKSPDDRPRDGLAVANALRDLAAHDGTSPAPRRAPRAMLTGTEQRVISVIAAGAPGDPNAGATAPTLRSDATLAAHGDLARVIAAHGGRAEFLAEGSLIVLLSPATSRAATDHAADAARCALSLRELLDPAMNMSLATGRAVVSDRWPAGEAIDRAARLVRHRLAASGIRLDEVTAGLLDLRFDVRGDDRSLVLSGTHDTVVSARTLLGRPTECIGRDRDLATLDGVWAECTAEHVARAVLVTGPPGIGKSRVRYEFLRRVAASPRPPTVWIGRGDALGAGAPFGLLAEALRRESGIFATEPVTAQRQKLRARVSRSVAPAERGRVAAFLGEMIGVAMDGDEPQLRAARLDPIVMGDQIRRAFEDFLSAECVQNPVLVVLEDLHWGDVPSVSLIDRALRNVGERPWMVLALARADVHTTFPSLWSERGLLEIRLSELSRRACERVVRSVLGDGVSDAVLGRIVERAAGNAFYLEELVRAVSAGEVEAFPETVLAMVEARLGTVAPDARRVLRAASVFGQIFWEGGVAALINVASADPSLRATLAELDQREFIARVGAGRVPDDTEYTFRHSVVREVALRMLTDEDRALGHRLAAEWLERHAPTDSLAIAEHFELGHQPLHATAWLERAAERAFDGNDLQGALALVERSLAGAPDDAARGRLRRLQAEALYWQAKYRESDLAVREALTRLQPDTVHWYESLARQAVLDSRLGQLSHLVEVAQAVLSVPVRSGDADAPRRAIGLARVAAALVLSGHLAMGSMLLERASTTAGDLIATEPAVRARILDVRALRAKVEGDPAEFTSLRTDAAAAYDLAGDLRNATMGRINLGYGLMELGRYHDAEREISAALDSAVRLGLTAVATSARHNLGFVCLRLGRTDEALAIESKAVEAAHAQGDRRMEYASRFYVGRILIERGEFAEAERQIANVFEDPDAARPLRAQSYAVRADARRRLGAAEAALADASLAVREIEALGGIEDGEHYSRLVYAEALHASGDAQGALAAIRASADLLRASAARISDTESRRCFLECVPENARTLELAAVWSNSAPRA